MLSLRKEAVCAAALCVAISAVMPAAATEYDWTAVEALLEASDFEEGALVINHAGAIEYAHGFGDYWSSYGPEQVLGENLSESINPVDNPILVYSLSKSFAAVAIIAAIEDSAVANLTYDTKINTLINDVSPAVNANMRIRHLLSMTNGQDSPWPYPSNLLTCINNPAYIFETCGKNVSNVAQALNTHTLNLFDRYAPGQAFSYGNVPWQYLGLAVLRAVNASISPDLTFTEMFRRYFDPPSADDACDFDDTTITPAGNEWVAGGFYTNPRDGIALAEVLRTGYCGSHQILSASGLETMRTNQGIGGLYEQYNPDVSNPPFDYGMGVWISDKRSGGVIVTPDVTDDDLYLGIGANGATVFFSPAGEWSAYLHVNVDLAAADAAALVVQLAPAIEEAIANAN